PRLRVHHARRRVFERVQESTVAKCTSHHPYVLRRPEGHELTQKVMRTTERGLGRLPPHIPRCDRPQRGLGTHEGTVGSEWFIGKLGGVGVRESSDTPARRSASTSRRGSPRRAPR